MSQSGRDMKRWVCSECDHIHTGQNPPMICPKCEADQDKFVFRKLNKEDYAKIRRGRKRLPDRSDILILGSGVSAFTAALVCSYYGMGVIVMEETDTIGGSDMTGFSDEERDVALESLRSYSEETLDPDYEAEDIEYYQLASSMLAFLSAEDVLPEFKGAVHHPKGAPHPWGSFSESRSLDLAPEPDAPQLKSSLLNQLSHWATDNEVRMLIRHKVIGILQNKSEVVTGVQVDFNDKEKPYHADLGIISFLNEENEKILDNSKNDRKRVPDTTGFHTVDFPPHAKLSKEEKKFWGENAKIGPSMTRAFKIALDIVDKSDLLEDLAQ